MLEATQSSMFASTVEEFVRSESGSVRLVQAYLRPQEADRLFAELRDLHGWRQDHIRVYGKVHPLPRLHRWFAESNEPYRWSGIRMQPEPFPECLLQVRQQIDAECGIHFNTALGNFYRDGRDGVSWHADDEPELGPNPVIASLSLGATRRFLLRKKLDHSECVSFDLSHGSLLWMSGDTQQIWEHSVPKSARDTGLRINLTFRAISAASDIRTAR
jgi:alkylated DNA repair dioxygenase AlkB